MKDDVDNLPSKVPLNAVVTKSVANALSNEEVNWFIEILYVVLPDIPTTKVVSNVAGVNAGNSDIFLVCLNAIFYNIISSSPSVDNAISVSVPIGISFNLPIT